MPTAVTGPIGAERQLRVLIVAMTLAGLAVATPALAAQGKPAAKAAAGKRVAKPTFVNVDGSLTRDGLVAIAFSAAGREKDKFDNKDLGKQFVGRRFLFAQYIADGDDTLSTTDAFWSYDKGTQKITFNMRSYVSDLYLKFTSKKVGEYTGQNGFGVKTRIKAFSEIEAKLWMVGPKLNDFEVTIDADPTEGRRLIKSTKLLVEGEIVPDESGKVSNCESSTSDPTISDPVAVATYTCYVYGKITRATFYDGDSHTELAVWSPR